MFRVNHFNRTIKDGKGGEMSKKWFYFSIIIATLFMISTAMAAKLSPVEKFGKAVYVSKKLSINQNQSCQTCHHQSAAFADPANKKRVAKFLDELEKEIKADEENSDGEAE